MGYDVVWYQVGTAVSLSASAPMSLSFYDDKSQKKQAY
jgi:hypothetical protein